MAVCPLRWCGVVVCGVVGYGSLTEERTTSISKRASGPGPGCPLPVLIESGR